MDMNGFDDTRETLLNQDSDETSDGEASSLESENDFSRQIRELRLQLERLEAFQRAPKSNVPEPAEEHHDHEEEIDQPDSPASCSAAASLEAGPNRSCIGSHGHLGGRWIPLLELPRVVPGHG